jgi:hypothetical protein
VGTPVPPAPPPYPLVDNAETLLDAADLVFVDAVGAGYSQAVSPYTNQSFWGVDADAALFRDFVRRWLAQNGREAAPKYLYGESYGGPRTAVLASLLETAGVRLAGVVLQSPALDYNGNCGLDDGAPTDCRGFLPSYGAAAEYHHRAQPAQPDLPAYMDLLRGYAADTYQPAVDTALQQGQPLSATVAAQLADYTGLSAALWQAQRVVWPGIFMGNLLPGRRLGRYDARFSARVDFAVRPIDRPHRCQLLPAPERVPAAGAGLPERVDLRAAGQRDRDLELQPRRGAPCPTRCPTWPPRGC